MTNDEQWVNERAEQLIGPPANYSMQVQRAAHRDIVVAALQEAIERTRAEERALTEMTVTLCGSTRFKAAYIDWFQRLTDQGLIVLTVGRYLPKKDHDSQLKADLDTLHFRKIDRSSRILVLDVGGYIGDSTRNEIAHAERTGKQVEYLSQLCPDYVEPPLTETDIGRAIVAEERAHATKALKLAHEMQDKAVAAERERCAKIAEGLSRMGHAPSHTDAPKMIAVAIRGPKDTTDD